MNEAGAIQESPPLGMLALAGQGRSPCLTRYRMAAMVSGMPSIAMSLFSALT